MTAPMSHRYDLRWFFQKDIRTGAPKDIVCWKVWMGGFEETMRWPWTEDGLAEAGAWLYEHKATNLNSGYPLLTADALMVHAGAR